MRTARRVSVTVHAEPYEFSKTVNTVRPRKNYRRSPRVRRRRAAYTSSYRDERNLSRVACPTELLQRFNQRGTEMLAVPSEYLELVATHG